MKNPIQVLGIDHVVLRVRDLSRALNFYQDVLGCREERRIDALGLVQLRAGSSLIDLVPLDSVLGRAGGAGPREEGRNVDHIALRIHGSDWPAVRERLEAAGLAPGELSERYGAEGPGLSLYLRDPDDNVIELRGNPLREDR